MQSNDRKEVNKMISAIIMSIIFSVSQLVLGILMITNDPPRPGVGLRTPRMLSNTELRKKTEKKIGKVQIASTPILIVLYILILIFDQSQTATLFIVGIGLLGIIVPLLLMIGAK